MGTTSRGGWRRLIAGVAALAALTAATAPASAAPAAPTRPVDKPNDVAMWAESADDEPGERIAIEIVLADETAPTEAAVVAAVRAAGGRVTGTVPGQIVQAAVAADAAAALDAATGVRTVRRPLPQDLRLAGAPDLEPWVDALTGEEVDHLNAAAWHTAGHTGSGVKLGIVDGFHAASWQAAVTAGDLPAVAADHTFCMLAGTACDIWGVGIKHGVAVAEIAHEVAPGAELYLATALTAADLDAAVTWFIANGVTVVNRSLGAPLDGPGDGTGPLDTIADRAVAAGIAWFNSAGNAAGRAGRQGDYYRASFTDTDGDGWHEFVNPNGAVPNGGPFEDLAMDCDGTLLSSLRWSDWSNLDDATDYDLYVFATPGGNRYGPGFDHAAALAHPDLVTAAFDDQGPGGAPPLEHLNANCTGQTVYLAIHRFADNNGSGGDVLEVMAEADVAVWSNPYSALYPIVDSDNPGVFGIGSVDADHTVAYYSSEGPTNDGRLKPDYTARSGVHTLSLPTFHGTSASSPAAAGLAALVLGAGRAASPAALRAWLNANAAHDRGACGPDTLFGFGELVLPDPNAPDAPAANPHARCAARFDARPPTRIFDTRPTEPAPGPKGKVPAETSVEIPLPDVPAGAVAVVANVTVTEPEAAGYVTVFPTGSARPVASNVNVTRGGQTRAALVTVPLGPSGTVSAFTKSAAHIVVDLAGYYVEAGAQAVSEGRFVAITPTRLFDTRPTEPGPGPKGPIEPRGQIDVPVLGQANLPTSGVRAVVINLTGTDARTAGYLTAFPTGTLAPLASTVNLPGPSATAPNLAIVPLGAGGYISVFSSHGAHAIADVVGYITDATAPASTTGLFVPLPPTRAFDTRQSAPLGPEATITQQIGATTSVPTNASAVALSVAAVDSPLGYLTVWNARVPRPLASTVNVGEHPLDTRANAAMVALGPGATLDVFSKSGGHVIADVTGYFL